MPNRYYLTVSDKQGQSLREIADDRGVSVVNVIRTCIRVSLMLYALSKEPDTKVIVRESGQDRELFLI